MMKALVYDALYKKAENFAEKLWEQSNIFEVWDIRSPSLVVHQLIACGDACRSRSDGQYSLLDDWLITGLPKDQLFVMHRGQFIKILADFDTPLDRRIVFQDFSEITLGELLGKHQEVFSLVGMQPYGISEQKYGAEFGWMLASFCYYLGSTGNINQSYSILDTINFMMKNGVNRSLEGGSHEFEGIVECYRKYKIEHKGHSYDEVEIFISGEISRLINASLMVDGQIYHGSNDGWAECDGEDLWCTSVRDLSKQAHFLDWAIHTDVFCGNPNAEKIISRFVGKMEDVFLGAKKENIQGSIVQYRYAGAVAHAIRVARQLRKRECPKKAFSFSSNMSLSDKLCNKFS